MPATLSNIKNSLNEEFCSQLEYHLTRTFGNSSDKEIRWLWCDGIEVPFADNELSTQHILDHQQILTKAWIGIDGQGIYQMAIKLGIRSISRCIEGLPLIDCLPSEESLDWVNLSIQEKIIELQLY